MLKVAIQVFSGVVLVVGGGVFFLSGVFNTGMRGAFSGGPWLPMSTAGRVVTSVIGAVLIACGVVRLIQVFV